MYKRFRQSEESGFTLIELIAVIAIVGIIATAISGAIIVGLRTTDDTSVRLGESHDTQIASAYLANDTQSADTIGGSCGSGSPVVSFQYKDGSVASYNYASVSGEQRLTRSYCPDNTTVTLAHLVGGTAPTATCDGGACAAGTKPNIVKIAVTEGTGYNFAVSGARRAFSAAGSPAPPASTTLLVLGSGIHLDKNARVTVNGNLSYSGGITTDQGAGITVTGSQTSPAGPDPLASMPAPTVAGNGSCTGSNPVVCTPGIHPARSFGSGAKVTFTPGYYQLAGLTFGKDSVVTSTGGVLLYMKTGSLSMGQNTSITLTPPPAGDPYEGLVYYQPTANPSTTLQIDKDSTITANGGIFYAPRIVLHWDQTTVIQGFKAIIVQGIDADQGSSLTVGP